MHDLPWEPLDDQLIVEQLAVGEKKTDSGLYIPDTAKERPNRGVVLAVGPGPLLEDGSRGPMECGVGDEVLYGEYSATDFEWEDVELKIVREENVLIRKPA